MDNDCSVTLSKDNIRDLLNQYLTPKIEELKASIYNDYISKTTSINDESKIKEYLEKIDMYFGDKAKLCQNCKSTKEILKYDFIEEKLTLCEKCLNFLIKSCTKNNTVKAFFRNKNANRIIFEYDRSKFEKSLEQIKQFKLFTNPLSNPNEATTNYECTKLSLSYFEQPKENELIEQKQIDNSHNLQQYINISPNEMAEQNSKLNMKIPVNEIIKEFEAIEEKVNTKVANNLMNKKEKFYEELKNNFKCIKNYKKAEVYSAIEQGNYDEEKVLEILLSKPYCHLS